MDLAGKVALVTGASRGIGRATALELARRGADVVITARTISDPSPNMPGTLSETAAGIEALGRRVQVVAADLSDADDVQRMAERALEWLGRVDVVVNNAYFGGRAAYQSLDELDVKNWNRQFAVNVTASFILAKSLVPQMRRAGGGAIVNITSASGLIGVYSIPGIAYGPTKAALNRLTTVLARDLEQDGIAVFAVDPGFTHSVLVDQTHEQTGIDPSQAHPPEVPAKLIADLVEADLPTTSGRVFRTVSGRGPFVVADVHLPAPEGEEIDLGRVCPR